MRKLFYLVGFLAVILVINFVMWFVHTRTIHNSVEILRKHLALYKIDLVHEGISFSSFKSWNVTGFASKVKLRLNSKNPHIVTFDRIDLSSNPFKEHVELQSVGKVFYTHKDGVDENIYEVKFHNGAPTVEVIFSTSLDTFSESLEPNTEDTPNALRNIKSLKYYDSGFDLVDTKKNASYAHFEGNKASLSSSLSNSSKKYDITLDVKGMKFDPSYPSAPQDAKIDKINIDSGLSTVHIDLSMLMQPSEHQLELIEKIKEKDKDAAVKKVLDSFIITFNNVNITTQVVNTTITGTINKQPTSGLLPYMNVNIKISDYEKCADIYFASLNHAIEKMIIEQPMLPLKPITNEQMAKFKKFLSQFSQNGKDMSVNLLRTKDIDLSVSGKSITDILNEIQATFFANFGAAPVVKRDNLKDRISNVAK